jgi:hypothetical protein
MLFDPTLPTPPELSEEIEERPAESRIARAEARLGILRELAELGMKLTRALVSQSVEPAEAATPGPRRDPADAFARLSRAVRLTLALEARTEDDLAALRAGAYEPPTAGLSRPDPAPTAPDDDADFVPPHERPLPSDYPSAFRNEIRDAVHDVINQEITDPYLASEALGDLYEGLWEGQDYDRFLHRSLRDAVAGICENLGLHPDWSLWTDDNWAPPTASGGPRWHERWVPRGLMEPTPRVYRAWPTPGPVVVGGTP